MVGKEEKINGWVIKGIVREIENGINNSMSLLGPGPKGLKKIRNCY